MAKAASRGKRKSSRRSKTKSQQGGILPWAALAVVVVGGILAYDNWWKHPAAVPVASASAKSSSNKPPLRPAEAKAPSQARATLPVPPAPVAARRPASPAVVEPRLPVPNDRPQPAASTEGVFKTAFGYCGDGAPRNCVADGGTFWHHGVKIRIAGISAPQVDKPGCEQERQLGVRAKVRLLKLLNEGPIGIEAADPVAGGSNANLRTVRRDGRSLGNILISEGLAQPVTGHKPWC